MVLESKRVLRDTFHYLNLWQNMGITRKSWNWGHPQFCTRNCCLTDIITQWSTLWTIWKSYKTLDEHALLPFPSLLIATWAPHVYGTRYQNIYSKQLNELLTAFWMNFMGRGNGSVCIQDAHTSVAVLKATRASTPFCRVSGRVADFSSI
jgi:hypothetical protein